MAHFAQLDSNNIVIRVAKVDNNDIEGGDYNSKESVGVSFLQSIHGSDTIWKQTSYNAADTRFRANYAGVGMTYMTGVAAVGVASTDIFIDVQPYPSWTVSTARSDTRWISPYGDHTALKNHSEGEHANNKLYWWDEAAYQADTGSPKTAGWASTSLS